MKRLDSYAAFPFLRLQVGKDLIFQFFSDHGNRLKQANANGATFSDLEAPYTAALTKLEKSKTGTVVNLTLQESETMTVDNYIIQFKADIIKLEPKVLVAFPKETTEYHEFFPRGRNAYNHTTKSNIDNHFATILSACTQHKDKLGTDPETEFTALHTAYVAARDRQQKKKSSTDSSRSEWDDNLDIVTDLAFYNLLTIAREYRGQPERIHLFFNQSIITPHKHKSTETSPAETI